MGCPQALPKNQSTRQGGGHRSVPGTLAWRQAVPVWLPQSRKRQMPEVTGRAAPADRGLLGRRGSGGRAQERAWAPWGTWRRGVTLRGTSARSPHQGLPGLLTRTPGSSPGASGLRGHRMPLATCVPAPPPAPGLGSWGPCAPAATPPLLLEGETHRLQSTDDACLVVTNSRGSSVTTESQQSGATQALRLLLPSFCGWSKSQ